MICPNCHNPVSSNARFCGTCGQSVSAADAAPDLNPPPLSAAAAGAPGAAHAAASSAYATASTAASAAMPGLLARIKNMILTPKTEWLVIAPEPTTPAQLYIGYVMPLAGLAAILTLVRLSMLGVSTVFGGSLRMPIAAGLTYAVITFVAALIGLFIVGFIINALAPTFAGQRDQRQALKVAAYAFTPAWLGSLLALSPVLPTLLQFIAGCYGIYVLYLGLPILMQSPRDKAVGYTVSVVICTILVGVVFAVISTVAGIGGMRHGLLGANSIYGPGSAQVAQEEGAVEAGNAIGTVLGTGAKGKAGLSAALANLAQAGAQSQAEGAAAAGSSAPVAGEASASGSTGTAPAPANAVAGLLTAFGGALGGPHPVNAVDFKALTALLPPSLPGMARTSAEGATKGALGVKASSATADYKGDGGSGVHIEITDISGVSGLVDLAGSLGVQTTESQSDTGYEKDVNLGGRTAHEKYDNNQRKGDVSVMVAKRFTVDVSGDNVDMHTLEQTLGQIDLARLESMKDAGAQPR